jgi:hypothetical protein
MATTWKGPGCLLLGKKLYKPGQELPAGALTLARIKALGKKVSGGAVAAAPPSPSDPIQSATISAPAPSPAPVSIPTYSPVPIKRGPGKFFNGNKVGPR